MKCLIVDDEPLAIRLIEKHIAQIESFEVVATCNTALKAFEILNKKLETKSKVLCLFTSYEARNHNLVTLYMTRCIGLENAFDKTCQSGFVSVQAQHSARIGIRALLKQGSGCCDVCSCLCTSGFLKPT